MPINRIRKFIDIVSSNTDFPVIHINTKLNAKYFRVMNSNALRLFKKLGRKTITIQLSKYYFPNPIFISSVFSKTYLVENQHTEYDWVKILKALAYK